MSQSLFTVVLVISISHALRAEKALLERGITSKLIPVPRHLSSDCGVCLRIERSCKDAAWAVLQPSPSKMQNGIEGFFDIG